MIGDKYKKLYVIVAVLLVIGFLGGQYFLKDQFVQTMDELVGVSAQVDEAKRTAAQRQKLLDRYKEFEQLVTSSGRPTQTFPETAMELFAVVDAIMKANSIEHTNRTSSSATEPGGVLQLDISFSGTYYNLLKALASLRQSEYVMRVATLSITAADGGRITGAMSILSNAKEEAEE